MSSTSNPIVSSSTPWLDGIEGDELPPLITSDDPIIRVEAGPGTGKTHGLKRRILRIMHRNGLNVPGENVLVVAFNRVIAKQLQSEISKLLFEAGIKNDAPIISTIHALCLEVIGEELRLLLPHEREAMIYDILEEHSAVKAQFETLRATEQALRDHEAKHNRHPLLRQAVDRWLTRHKARLISDVPDMLLDRLRLGDGTPQEYLHIVVDEFQDLTPGEQELFARMRIPGGSFLALGDPRQSIYLFRGNDRAGLSKLESLLKVAPDEITDITIQHCRRCPGDIVSAANELMVLYTTAPMQGELSRKSNTHVVVWETPQQEAVGMAKAIVANLKANPPNNDMRHLVMVTRRQFGYLLREEIRKVDPNIRVDLSFSEGLLDKWAVREAFLLFCLLTDPDPATWRAWLSYQNTEDGKEFKANKRNAAAYLNLLSGCKDSINELVMRSYADGSAKATGAGSLKIKERAKRYFDLQPQFADKTDATSFIEKIFNINAWLASSASDYKLVAMDMDLVCNRALELLNEVKDAKESPVSADEQLRKVAQSLRYAIAVREPFAEDKNIDLQVTTFWSAKGLTANHVYVVGLVDETIPGSKRDEYPGTETEYNEEQRRLFYVSLTRSKNTIVLSRARKIKRSEAPKLGIDIQPGSGAYAALNISPFLRDIIDFLPDGVQGENWLGCIPVSL